MRRLICTMSFLLAGLVMSACVVASDNPAASVEESTPLPEAWIGRWAVERIADEIPRLPTEVEVELNADGTPQMTLHEGDRTLVLPATLIQQGARWLLSTRSLAGHWSIAALEVDAAGTSMTVRTLDLAQVKADVTAGLVPGVIEQFGSNDDLVQLTATSVQLRAYLASRPAAFGNLSASLVKLPEEPPSGTP